MSSNNVDVFLQKGLDEPNSEWSSKQRHIITIKDLCREYGHKVYLKVLDIVSEDVSRDLCEHTSGEKIVETLYAKGKTPEELDKFLDHLKCKLSKCRKQTQTYSQYDNNDFRGESAPKLCNYSSPSKLFKKLLEEASTVQVLVSYDLKFEASTQGGALKWDVCRNPRKKCDGKCSLSSDTGYKMCICTFANDEKEYGTHVNSLFFTLTEGEFDALQKVAFDCKFVFKLVDHSQCKRIVHTLNPTLDRLLFRQSITDMNTSDFAQFEVEKCVGSDGSPGGTIFFNCMIDTCSFNT